MPAVVVVFRVPDLVIRDLVPVIRRQLVVPVRITIGVVLRGYCRPGIFIRGVRILFGLGQVSALVVAVDDRLVQPLVVFPDQFVLAVVAVSGFDRTAFFYFCDVPVRIIRIVDVQDTAFRVGASWSYWRRTLFSSVLM